MNKNLYKIVLAQNLRMLKTRELKNMCRQTYSFNKVICSGETEFHILITELLVTMATIDTDHDIRHSCYLA